MLSESNVLADLYGALATVVAVTIALQQQVVAQCFDECQEFSKHVSPHRIRFLLEITSKTRLRSSFVSRSGPGTRMCFSPLDCRAPSTWRRLSIDD
jgi:hypothetical protein